MPFPPTPNTIKVAVTGQLAGQQVTNVYYVEKISAWTSPELEQVADEFIAWLRTEVLPLLATEFVYTLIEILDLTTANGIYYTRQIDTPNTGQVASPAMPNECAVCLSLRTAQSGRSFRGRKYMSGVPENNVTNNTVTTPYLQAWVNAFNGLLLTIGTAGWSWVVVSTVENGVPRAQGVTTAINSVIFTDDIIDSQRSRKPGVGS